MLEPRHEHAAVAVRGGVTTATRPRDGRVLVVGGYDDRIAVADAARLLRP